ncbi:unnamed protein product, partial [Bubo scandiacus]
LPREVSQERPLELGFNFYEYAETSHSVVWVGLGRFGNDSDMKARPRSHTSINALLTPLLKQNCFVNHLHGLTLVYKLHKEAFGIINCICTA